MTTTQFKQAQQQRQARHQQQRAKARKQRAAMAREVAQFVAVAMKQKAEAK